MAERVKLAAEPRTVLGKQVRRLRRDGRLPANVYGKGIDSTAITLDAREFGRAIKTTGIRHLFDVQIDGEPSSRPVVIRGLSRAGGMGEPIHVDFFQVDPNRPIAANVPVRLVGEAPAVRDLAGTLVHGLDNVAIRCRPLQIPEFVEVNVTSLTSFDATVTVAEIVPPEGVQIMTDPAIVVATVSPPRLRLEGAEEEAAAEEAEGAEEQESAEE